LADKLGLLKDLHGHQVIGRWQAWALAGDLRALFQELMVLHYDPLYNRSQSNNFSAWATRQTLETDDLTQAGVDALAQRIAQL
jgi:tRNA 2-selenouridine synthase